MSDRPLDPDCLRYARHWEPVLAGAARRTLTRLDGTPATFLDLGAGTGSLTLAAADRWPSARLVAVDASGAMLGVARSRAAERGIDPARLEWLAADAADLPLHDGVVDAAASSFLLQLVADRLVVLREVGRVLRPGGRLSFVTWLAQDMVLPADSVYHEVVGDIDGEDEEDGFRSPRSGDYHSLDEAHGELTEAGYDAIEVVRDELRYRWTPASYLDFKVGYDDHERIESLDEARRHRLVGTLVERLADLPGEAFEVRGPLVAATARRPVTGD